MNDHSSVEKKKPSICIVGLENYGLLYSHIFRGKVGGSELQQMLLAKQLVQLGYAIEMLCIDVGQPAVDDVSGIKVIRTFNPHEGPPGLRFFYPRLWTLLRSLLTTESQIIYVSTATPLLALAVIAGNLRGKKVIWKCASDMDCEKVTLRRILGWIDRVMYVYGLRRATMRLVQTAKQSQILWDNFGLSARIVPPLIDSSEDTKPLPLSARSYSVLWVGNFHPEKRPDVFIKVAQALPQFSFELIGGPSTGHESFYESVVRSADAVANVKLTGPKPYYETALAIASCRVLVNTSRREGFPNTFLQAWRAGTPLVATFDPDGMVAANGAGLVANDPKEVTMHVANLMIDDVIWAAVSSKSRSLFERQGDMESSTAAYEELFKTVADLT